MGTATIHIIEDTLPRAWENAVRACWYVGNRIETEYDKPEDPHSRDVAAMIVVRTPFAEPRIHRAMPGGLGDLEKYRMEVLHGVHDHLCDPTGESTKWSYSYYQRLREYETGHLHGPFYDQLEAIVEKLKTAPFTRRAQMVTWRCWVDQNTADPPCLQRMWFRIVEGKLNMHMHIRSNDAFKAGFMNMYAFTEFQNMVATLVGVLPGEYIHFADSFHIYGSYFDEFSQFLDSCKNRTFDERVYDSRKCAAIFVDGLNELLLEDNMPPEKQQLCANRIMVLEMMSRHFKQL